jgi:PhnB protein
MTNTYPTIVPYLVVNGAADAIEFMKNAFGAEERLRVPRGDGTLQHAEVVIGDSVVEIGDATEQWNALQVPLHLYVPNADAVYAAAIRAGATSLRAPVDQPYGDREAGVTDRWGNQWFIATHQEEVAEDEMMRRFQGQGTPIAKDPSVAPVPEGFRTVTVNLRVPRAARIIDFTTQAFGATELNRTALPDGSILHALIRIGDSVIELGEPHGEWRAIAVGVHVFVDDADAVYTGALAAGATSLFPVDDAPYGQRIGGVRDEAGNHWFIATVT